MEALTGGLARELGDDAWGCGAQVDDREPVRRVKPSAVASGALPLVGSNPGAWFR